MNVHPVIYFLRREQLHPFLLECLGRYFRLDLLRLDLDLICLFDLLRLDLDLDLLLGDILFCTCDLIFLFIFFKNSISFCVSSEVDSIFFINCR